MVHFERLRLNTVFLQKDNREPCTQELYVTAMSAILHQILMAL